MFSRSREHNCVPKKLMQLNGFYNEHIITVMLNTYIINNNNNNLIKKLNQKQKQKKVFTIERGIIMIIKEDKIGK